MEAIWENVARVVEVSEAEIAFAMRVYYRDSHNLAEGAGAAALAGAIKEKLSIGRIAVVLTGANVDAPVYADVIAGGRSDESD